MSNFEQSNFELSNFELSKFDIHPPPALSNRQCSNRRSAYYKGASLSTRCHPPLRIQRWSGAPVNLLTASTQVTESWGADLGTLLSSRLKMAVIKVGVQSIGLLNILLCNASIQSLIPLHNCNTQSRVGERVESALSALAAIFFGS